MNYAYLIQHINWYAIWLHASYKYAIYAIQCEYGLLGLVMLVQSSAIITSSIYHNITYGAGSTVTEYKSDFKLTTDTPHLTPICEL